jgi:hypothetical protein
VDEVKYTKELISDIRFLGGNISCGFHNSPSKIPRARHAA